MHSWAGDKPLRLAMHTAERDDPEPKALACYGLWLPARARMLLRGACPRAGEAGPGGRGTAGQRRHLCLSRFCHGAARG